MTEARNYVTVATHVAPYHADDIFASAAIALLLPNKKINYLQIRSRLDLEKEVDFIIDVGEKYDPQKGEFDHHQGGTPVRKDGTPRASFGLVWKKYGQRICTNVVGKKYGRQVAIELDNTFVKFIDYIDTRPDLPFRPKKGARVYLLQTLFDSFNPLRGEEGKASLLFREAVNIARRFLERKIKRTAEKARAYNKIKKEYKVQKQPEVLVLNECIQWSEHLYHIDKKECVKAVVFPSRRGGWAVRCVPKDPSDRGAGDRIKLLAKKQYERIITVKEEVLFVHKNKWIGRSSSCAGAIKMAKIAIGRMNENSKDLMAFNI